MDVGKDDGLTIIGVMIAVALMVVALIPASSLLDSTTIISSNSQDRVIASHLATQILEADRTLAANSFTYFADTFVPLSGKTNSIPSVIPNPYIQSGTGVQFTSTQTLSWLSIPPVTGSTPPYQYPDLLQLTATVRWGQGTLAGGTVTVSTQLSAPTSSGVFGPLPSSTVEVTASATGIDAQKLSVYAAPTYFYLSPGNSGQAPFLLGTVNITPPFGASSSTVTTVSQQVPLFPGFYYMTAYYSDSLTGQTAQAVCTTGESPPVSAYSCSVTGLGSSSVSTQEGSNYLQVTSESPS